MTTKVTKLATLCAAATLIHCTPPDRGFVTLEDELMPRQGAGGAEAEYLGGSGARTDSQGGTTAEGNPGNVTNRLGDDDPSSLAPGELGVSSEAIAFGPVVVGFAAPARLTLDNPGATPLSAPELSILGDGAEQFFVTANGCADGIPAADTCTVGLAFQPTAAGAASASLEASLPTGEGLSVSLRGEGLEPGELIVEADADNSTDFGDLLLGESVGQTLRLTNPGASATGALSFSLNAEAFNLLPPEGDGCVPEVSDLAGGESCTLRVLFSPTVRGVAETTTAARCACASRRSPGEPIRQRSASRLRPRAVTA
jgi:hypothetical protein